jgi:hypothetical protein
VATTQRGVERAEGDTKADGVAGHVNTGLTLLAPVIAKLSEPLLAARAAAARAAAHAKAALTASMAAGSGGSRLKSLRAGIAAKAAARASRDAKKLAAAAAKASKATKILRWVAASLEKLPLNAIGFGLSGINKYSATTNRTTFGRLTDVGITATLDTAFSMANPLTAAADALVGLIPENRLIPHPDRYNISTTMGEAISSITGSVEAIVTGDTTGLADLQTGHQEKGGVFGLAADAGEWSAEAGGGAERAQTTGDFYGGPSTVAGRAGAFSAAIPGLGHAGELLGEGAAAGILGIKEMAQAAYERLTSD